MPKYVGDPIELKYQEIRKWDKLYHIILGREKPFENKNIGNADPRIFIKAMNNLKYLSKNLLN